ncbi:flagellar biosynthesis protein FlhA [Photobacterium rosenbergii]|uniref:flagellar biosynthesis protein FlhA n=1 Tax=Photobacterium rosenbergii TaxID=294936 RepID=UPI001C994C1D|nr:flagellar biosynthesis protein FlhA [Photobacterium rosenbergii]MBY5947931.1 flagellar biosynthesis protein FlhA [Photobacterium rosenbergii]
MKAKLQQLFPSLTTSYLGIPIMLLAILAMVILPLPPWLLDALFIFNIVLAVIVLLVAVSSKRPLDFSVFPTILLVATLMRLTLNVASTRVVLLNGHLGGDAAGKVIQAFGDVVVGGNYFVGIVVFVILMIINFVVITKGGERISEVSARFTLDALPGKQMAIDADLNAGLIDQDQARTRREEVAREADFYGSMDGASKFVRGDAIAGLMILVINILGGITIGMVQHDLAASEAFQRFALLTIGDGLVAQIPSLLLATAAAIIVTRVNDSGDISVDVHRQMLASPATLFTASAIMLIIGLVPGMPHLAFFIFAAVLAYAGWKQRRIESDPEPLEQAEAVAEAIAQDNTPTLGWNDVPVVNPVALELGYRLVNLVDKNQGEPLAQRIRGVRKTITEQVGFLIPEIAIRDNLKLKPTQYSLLLHGEVIAQGEIDPERLMALAVGEVYGQLDGVLGKDPAYNLDAVWIEPANKPQALNQGYSVVDGATVIATHLSKILKEHLAELFCHDDVERLMERLGNSAPKLMEALTSQLNHQQQMRVFRQLLVDQVPIKDIANIASIMVESSEITKDPILIAADIRSGLKRSLTNSLVGSSKDFNIYTLSDNLEKMLLTSLSKSQQSGGQTALDSFPVEPTLLAQLQQNMPAVKEQLKQNGFKPILLVTPQLRPLLARYARTFAKGLVVLSYNEIPEDKNINVLGHLG